MASITSVNSLCDLAKCLDEYSNQLVVLYFYIDNSAECAQVGDVLEELSKGAEDMSIIIKINSSKEEICKEYEISDVPSVVFILDGKIVDKVVGVFVPVISKMFGEHIKALQESLNDRLKKLINKSTVMLFMKGNPSAPRCGFSKQVIALLNSHNAKYETFDILEDYEVREALKKYSNWPTYPQLYVKGELIGGLDIMKELSESGELDAILSG